MYLHTYTIYTFCARTILPKKNRDTFTCKTHMKRKRKREIPQDCNIPRYLIWMTHHILQRRIVSCSQLLRPHDFEVSTLAQSFPKYFYQNHTYTPQHEHEINTVHTYNCTNNNNQLFNLTVPYVIVICGYYRRYPILTCQ